MTIVDLAGKHINELDACMAELRVRFRALAERDHVRLDADLAVERVTKEVIEVPGLGAAPLDPRTLARLDEGAISALLGVGEELRDRDVERLGERVETRERRRDAAVLDLG